MDKKVCKICNLGEVDDDEWVSSIREKGAAGLNRASDERNDGLLFAVGDSVHINCRRNYTNARKISSAIADICDIDHNISPKKTRSREGSTFHFQTNCFLCGTALNDRAIRDQDYVQVKCKKMEVDEAMEKAIVDRNEDRWAVEVKGRLSSCNDLRAEDAIYHTVCNSNFRTGKSKPKQFEQTGESSSQKRGRRCDLAKEAAEYLVENDDEQITVCDLTDMMAKLCLEPYSNKWMKKKLENHFGDDIIFANSDGKSNVVTFLPTAKKILTEFYDNNDPTSDDIEGQKRRILETAAKIIKNEVKSLGSVTTYPAMDEFEAIEKCLDYIPTSLKTLMAAMFVAKNSEIKIAFLGQSIMQQIRPRALIAPLQIGVAVQMHHQYASRFLNDSLNAMGFASSYTEVTRFERNAAIKEGVNIANHVNQDSFVQFMADNVDHNTRTIDGENTFHAMGIIASVTPLDISNNDRPVKFDKCMVTRLNVTAAEIIEAGKIERDFFTTKQKTCNKMTFKTLKQQ